MTGRASLCPTQRVAANAVQAKAGGACWGRAGKVSAKRLLEAPEKASAWPGETPCQLRVVTTALDAQLPLCEQHERLQPSPWRGARAGGEGARALAC